MLAPSAFSGREIVRFTGVPEARVRVIHLGVREVGPSTATRRPTVLFVGTLFQRRRIDVLVDAFARVASRFPDAHLDIVGENRTVPRVDYAAQVASLGLGARVSVRHWVDDETLATLYAQATAFAFLSEYEGFGFTPLEALAHGAVPVVLDTPVAREIYGDAAVRVEDGPDVVATLADGPGAAPRRSVGARAAAGRRARCPGQLPLGRHRRPHLARPRRGRRCLTVPASPSSSSPTTSGPTSSAASRA